MGTIEIIKILKETVKDEDLTLDLDQYNLDFEISPVEFIKYAYSDLESETEHKYVNALSNAKRAIDSQIEGLLKLYGLHKKSKKQNWGFPKKLEPLNRIGIITPQILKKLNQQRNILEHEFIKPNNEKVEDFVDIASLFIESSNKEIFNYPYIFEAFLNNPDRAVYCQLFPEKGIKIFVFDYTGYCDKTDSGGKKFEQLFTSEHENYIEFLKLYRKHFEQLHY
ncbi:hypothetical protein [Aquimarina megaterium]|uniref:hypothetical protein n=1 Tax=Aquimarina megaterium TaxID=1443666 RepID=UPI0004712E13|nr:hypothetical protein [Aquimarina megaterium]